MFCGSSRLINYSDVARVCCPQTQQSQAKHNDAGELLHCQLCTQEHPVRRVQGVKPHLKRLLTALPSLLTYKCSKLALKLWRVQSAARASSGSLADMQGKDSGSIVQSRLFKAVQCYSTTNQSFINKHPQNTARLLSSSCPDHHLLQYLLTAWNTHIQPDNHYHPVNAKTYHQLYKHVLTRSVRHNTWVLMQTGLRDCMFAPKNSNEVDQSDLLAAAVLRSGLPHSLAANNSEDVRATRATNVIGQLTTVGYLPFKMYAAGMHADPGDAHKSLYNMHATKKLLWHMRHTPECVYLKARSVSAYHFINLSTVVLLNVPQYPDVVALDKVDSNTLQNDTLQCQQYNTDTPDQGTNRGTVDVLQLCIYTSQVQLVYLAAISARSAYSVDVQLTVVGQVIIDDQGNLQHNTALE